MNHDQVEAKERRTGAEKGIDAKDPKEDQDHDHNHDHQTIDQNKRNAVAVHAGTRRTKSRAAAQDPKEQRTRSTADAGDIEQQAQAEYDKMAHDLGRGIDEHGPEHARPRERREGLRPPSPSGIPSSMSAAASSYPSEGVPMSQITFGDHLR